MLRELPAALGQLTALRTLSLAGNRLTSLPATLSALTVGSDCVVSLANMSDCFRFCVRCYFSLLNRDCVLNSHLGALFGCSITRMILSARKRLWLCALLQGGCVVCSASHQNDLGPTIVARIPSGGA